jgi:hypothetical protein
MGFASWDCPLCEHSVRHHGIPPRWMSEAVLVKGQRLLRGDYDGYGRLHTESGTVKVVARYPGRPMFYHQACFDIVKPKTFQVSGPAADQGHFTGDYDPPEPKTRADLAKLRKHMAAKREEADREEAMWKEKSAQKERDREARGEPEKPHYDERTQARIDRENKTRPWLESWGWTPDDDRFESRQPFRLGFQRAEDQKLGKSGAAREGYYRQWLEVMFGRFSGEGAAATAVRITPAQYLSEPWQAPWAGTASKDLLRRWVVAHETEQKMDTSEVFVNKATDALVRAQGARRKNPMTPYGMTPEGMTVRSLSDEFSRILRKQLSEEEMREVIECNRTRDPGVCHSHDFCDANMAMAAAFDYLGIKQDRLAEFEDLWGKAWTMSIDNEFRVEEDDESAMHRAEARQNPIGSVAQVRERRRGNPAEQVFRFPEGVMTQREWVERYAARVEAVTVDWHRYMDRHKWNRMDGPEQAEYEKKLKKKAEKPEYRAWRHDPNGDVFQVISKSTYDWAVGRRKNPTGSRDILQVTSDQGVPWLVRIVRKGDRHGLEDKLVYKDDRPEVEFFDASVPHAELAPCRLWTWDSSVPSPCGKSLKGQFASSYYVHTLLKDPRGGLDLHGGVPKWKIDGDTMDVVRDWLREQTKGRHVNPAITVRVERYADGVWAVELHKPGYRQGTDRANEPFESYGPFKSEEEASWARSAILAGESGHGDRLYVQDEQRGPLALPPGDRRGNPAVPPNLLQLGT